MYTTEQIARVCHEAYAGFCDMLGDHSQSRWDDAPEWQRQSAIKGVEFNQANPEAPASAPHNSWLVEKTEQGWKYGPVKDADKKEHPWYVPYDYLPMEQRTKDYLFKAIVAAMSVVE